MDIVPTVDLSERLKTMTKPHLKLITPAIENRTVTPNRRPNTAYRTREYLTGTEVERLIEAAKANRHGHRDATMVLVAFRHGLRASELVDLRWDQVDFNKATLAVRRVKKGTPATQPIQGDQLRALRSERGSPFTPAGFAKMQDGGACWCCRQDRVRGASSHAAACLWLCPGQRRARYKVAAGVSGAQEHPAYGALHRADAQPIQELLEGLEHGLMPVRWLNRSGPGSGERSRSMKPPNQALRIFSPRSTSRRIASGRLIASS
jgi:integrase